MFKCTVLICLLIVSIYNDLRHSKIKNMHVLLALTAGIFINIGVYGIAGLAVSVKGIVLPILLLGIFLHARLIGAGDIKLFSAIGAMFGWKFVLYTMVFSFLFAGFTAVILLLKKSKLISIFSGFCTDLKICFFTNNISHIQNSTVKHTIKLSPAIAAGAVLQVLLC